jgi:hypothetical protein
LARRSTAFQQGNNCPDDAANLAIPIRECFHGGRSQATYGSFSENVSPNQRVGYLNAYVQQLGSSEA